MFFSKFHHIENRNRPELMNHKNKTCSKYCLKFQYEFFFWSFLITCIQKCFFPSKATGGQTKFHHNSNCDLRTHYNCKKLNHICCRRNEHTVLFVGKFKVTIYGVKSLLWKNAFWGWKKKLLEQPSCWSNVLLYIVKTIFKNILVSSNIM